MPTTPRAPTIAIYSLATLAAVAGAAPHLPRCHGLPAASCQPQDDPREHPRHEHPLEAHFSVGSTAASTGVVVLLPR